MIKKFSLFAVVLLCLQLLLPLTNAFAFELLAPTNLTASQYYPGNITLKWDKVSGASAYRVYKLDGDQREFVQQVSYQYTETTIYGVPEGISTFAVTAVRNASESGLSNSVTVEVVYPEMQSPSIVSSSIANGNDLTLSWDKATYATDYNIYQVINDTRTLIATTKALSYTFENHPQGKYIYEITSYNSRFGESAKGAKIEVNVVFPEMQPPVVTYSIQNGNDLVFNWQRVTYASNYRVYEVIDGERELLTITKLNSYLISNVSAGKHVYEITSYSDRFGESAEAFQIELDMIYPEMQAPKSFTYTLSNVNDINLRWSQVEYAESYKLYQYVNGDKKLILSTSALNTTLKNMPEGQYKYEISSYSSRFGESTEVASLEFNLVHPEMQAPLNLNLSVVNGNDLVLRWDTVEYATAYKIYQIINGERKLVITKLANAHTFVNMPEGHYTFEVTSYSDRFGESKTGSRIEYDLKHPVLQAPVLTGKVEEPNTIILDWTKTENATGYNIYEVVNDTKKLVATTTSLQHKFLNMKEGLYTFEVTSYNTRFGESEFSNQVTLYITPKLEAPKTSEPRVEDDKVTISWSPVQNAQSYNVYEVVNGELRLVENTTETSLTINDLEPGGYEYYIVPVSESGLESESYSTVKVQIEQLDTVSPVTTLNITESCSKEDIVVKLTATDDQSGVAQTFYSIDGSEFQEGTSFTISEEGKHEISFYSVDNVGNVEDLVKIEVHQDKTAPVTVLPIREKWFNKETTVQLSASDNLCGVEKTVYSVNGSEFQEGTSLTLTEDGVHKVSFYSVDKAGNVEEVKTVEVKVDKTAPVTTSNVTDKWYKEEMVVQLTATDNLSGVDKTFYSIDGSAFIEGNVVAIQEEGIHKVSFYSIDKAGNIEETKTVEVKIDKTAPVVSWNPESEYTLGSKLNLDYEASDALSGIASKTVTLNGKILDNADTVTLDKPGTYQVVITVTDHAGWTTTLEKKIVVYISATIEVLPKVIKGNNGIITVKVTLPQGYNPELFDLYSATLNGVKAVQDSNGMLQQAKKGQFKFEREEFEWNEGEVELKFRALLDGQLVVGSKTVKVLAN
jgi:large repetitive protein